MKLAIAQLDTRSGDLETAATRMIETSRAAIASGVELLIFPAHCLTGASALDYPDQAGFSVDLAKALMRISEELACPALIPIVLELDNIVYRELVLADHDGLMPLRLKNVMDAMPLHGSAEDVPVTLETGDLKFVFVHNRDEYEELAGSSEGDYDVLFYIAEEAFAVDEPVSALGSALSETSFISDAQKLGSWIVAVASLGVKGMLVHSGSSFVLTPKGTLAAQAPSFEESLLVFDVGRRTETNNLPEALSPEIYDRQLLLWNALSFGLKGTCEELGYSDVVLVVDDSLESHLLAVLASDALGPTHVHAILGPGGLDSRASAASELMGRIRVEPIGEAASLAQALDTLSDYACTHSALALGAHTKTSLALRQKSSLRAEAFSPFSDVYGSELVALARFRNTISPVLSPEVMTSFCVPEFEQLPKGISAEEKLDLLDNILLRYVEWDLDITSIVEVLGNPELVENVVKRLHTNALFRAGAGAMLVMSSKTLGELKRAPGFAWNDYKRDEEDLTLPPSFGNETDQSILSEFFGHRQRAMHDAFELMRDMSFTGLGMQGFGGMNFDDDKGENPLSGMLWGSPFSDN